MPAGCLCSRRGAELVAVRAALSLVHELEGPLASAPVVVCLDSRVAPLLLNSGPAAQSTDMGADGGCCWRWRIADSTLICSGCRCTAD